jgi:hypothetical protein
MDLIVAIGSSVLEYQRVPMSYIHVFLTTKFSESIECNEEYYLGKDDMKDLISFLESKDFALYDSKDFIIGQLRDAIGNMSDNECASFRFW